MRTSIRPFEEKDATLLAGWWLDILTQYWNQSVHAYKPESEREQALSAFSSQALAQRERDPDAVGCYLLEVAGKLLGTVRLSRHSEEESVLILTELQVKPGYHGRGLGKALVKHCVEEAFRLEYQRIDLTTWAFNRKGIPLYKKSGFFWVPETSVYMQNYIPFIFQTREGKDFLSRHDWYNTFRRDITFRPDVYEEGGRPVFSYTWEENSERLEMRIDWQEHSILPAAAQHRARSRAATPSDKAAFDFATYTGRRVKVGILDSGIAPSHPDVGTVAGGVRISVDPAGKVILTSDYEDTVGHGTACAGIIHKKAPDAQLYAIKIFMDASLSAGIEALVEAIRWGADNGMRILNVSLGTTNKDHIPRLREACDYASGKGTIIIAAESNEGEESYPAIFPNVLGVTGGKLYGKYSYFCRPGEAIEFVARGDEQRLAWVDPEYIFMGGTSFAAAHLTAIVALIVEAYPSADLEQIREILAANASKGELERNHPQERPQPSIWGRAPQSVKRDESSPGADKYPWIRRAVLYPYNKEMHALIRFRDLLKFQIVGVADPVGKGLVGQDAGEAIGLEPVGITIQHNLAKVLQEGDTLILGHVDQLGRISRRDVLGKTIAKAIELGKNVFSFSRVHEEKYHDLMAQAQVKALKIVYPLATWEDVSKDHVHVAGGMRNTEVPVVGIFGTGPQQGKFTTQLTLRRELLRQGYRVGQIGTEPHSELFGCDVCFPNGYDGTVTLPVEHHAMYLRRKMAWICNTVAPDIIIVGAQSGIIPYNPSIPSGHTLPSIAFLFGTNPDAYILTVNSMDPEEYIQDTMDGLRVLGKRKTILLVMSDKAKDIRSAYGTSRVVPRQMSPEEMKAKLSQLEDRFGIPATEVVSREGARKLVTTVIDYFAEDADNETR